MKDYEHSGIFRKDREQANVGARDAIGERIEEQGFSRPFGTNSPLPPHPRLKPWAILGQSLRDKIQATCFSSHFPGKSSFSGIGLRVCAPALLILLLVATGCKTHKQGPPPPMMTITPGGSPSQVTPQGLPSQPAPQGLPNQPGTQAVYVLGKVANHVIPWRENLTLAEALLAARYQDMFDPRVIFLIRQGQTTRIDPKQLLKGKVDPVLLPGDVVSIQN